MRAAIFAIALLASSAAAAQPAPRPDFALPPESITVTGSKPSEETIRSYVEKRIQPTRVVGRLARWQKKLCPQTIGLGATYAKYVTQRIRDIAAAVGAPLDPDLACKPNVEVMFTTTPQALLDNVRHTAPILLGYHDNQAQADRMARVTHSIQAWYMTESMDMDGSRSVDSGLCGFERTITIGAPGTASGDTAPALQMTLPCALAVHSNGFHAHDGLSSGLFNVLIVAEPAKLYDYELGALADYIAMLALSQPPSQDACQDLPSISNLLAPGCRAVAAHITDGDLAYLRGLYKMPEGYGLAAQINQLNYQMTKVLVTDKGGAN
jgi:hypothetical protein